MTAVFADPVFDELIEAARQERVAVIPLLYGRSTAFVQPRVHGWWEFGKSSANFADLVVGHGD